MLETVFTWYCIWKFLKLQSVETQSHLAWLEFGTMVAHESGVDYMSTYLVAVGVKSEKTNFVC